MPRRRAPLFRFRVPFTQRVYAFGQALPPQYDEIGSPGARTGGRGPGAPLLNGQLGEEDYCPEWTVDRRYDLINKMRLTDDDLRAVFAAITLPIERAPFEVVPAKDAPPDDQVIADFVWHELTHLRDMTWSNFLHQALLAPAFGNMIFEKVWRLGTDGRVHLRALSPRMPDTVDQYNVDDNGTLISVQQQTFGSRRGSALVTLPREKLLLLVHDQEGANFRGRSIFRAAYRSWFMQQNLEVIANVAAERRSMGVDDLLIKGNTTPERQAAAERAARLLHAGHKGFFSHGDDVELNVKGVQGSTYDIVPLIELYRKRKITGMGAPMLLLGQGGTGSYALSRDKTDLFMLGIEAIADALVDAINQDIVQPLCEYNFGARPDSQPYPRLQYQKLDTRQAIETITALAAATGAGLITPTLDTENEIRRLAEIDELTEADAPARAAHRAAMAPGFGPGKPAAPAPPSAIAAARSFVAELAGCGDGAGGFESGNSCGSGEGGGAGGAPRTARLRDRIEGTQAEADREVKKANANVGKIQHALTTARAAAAGAAVPATTAGHEARLADIAARKQAAQSKYVAASARLDRLKRDYKAKWGKDLA